MSRLGSKSDDDMCLQWARDTGNKFLAELKRRKQMAQIRVRVIRHQKFTHLAIVHIAPWLATDYIGREPLVHLAPDQTIYLCIRSHRPITKAIAHFNCTC